MRIHIFTSVIVCMTSALLLSAEPEPETPADEEPPIELFMAEEEVQNDFSDWNDPAFTRMVDFELMTNALAEGNATGVTDVALQLAEAERILLRNHPKIDSNRLLQMAMKMAVNKNDKDNLARLNKVAKATNNEELTSQLEAATMLGGESRAIIPPAEINVDTPPEDVAAAQELADNIELAENISDRKTLGELRVDVGISELPENLKTWLNSKIDQAEQSVGEEVDEEAEALTSLVGASRGGFLGNFKLKESETIIGPAPGWNPPPKTQPPKYQGASGNRMKNLGYRKFNDVNINKGGRVTIGGKYAGQAKKTYNPRTKQHYYNFNTKKGGRIVQQSNGKVWVRPGQQQQQQNQGFQSGGGKHLGTVPNFWSR
ncbi:hypothetical protein Pla110_18670 [Polystyrenella longa]|uniref:Uncharacterized protein n=1 Tax=Polystyrenella longa TaxID=2528007 RepID=A0A518CLT1_9PLAN|nr:hypothetical protein [Polystyrenella longa]QDU80144.1 hypothetical protein Pla110_18670 [Polystyrenella longa]